MRRRPLPRTGAPVQLELVPLARLRVRDERSFRHLPLYTRLKARLLEDGQHFRAPPRGAPPLDWSRALALNLVAWGAADPADVLVERAVDADVLMHAAWHHVVRGLLSEGEEGASAEALLFGEAVASAFDLYLVGAVLGRVPRSAFLRSQLPAMAAAAEAAGQPAAAFRDAMAAVAAAPEAAFEDLRTLLFDLTTELVAGPGAAGVDGAAAAFARHAGHRFAPLLHHFELAGWVLYARAHGRTGPDPEVRALDAAMRAAPDSLALLAERALAPRETSGVRH
jgi:hypothetical protein